MLRQRLKKRFYKTSGTSAINSPLSPFVCGLNGHDHLFYKKKFSIKCFWINNQHNNNKFSTNCNYWHKTKEIYSTVEKNESCKREIYEYTGKTIFFSYFIFARIIISSLMYCTCKFGVNKTAFALIVFFILISAESCL